MDIKTTKLELVKMILGIENPQLINRLKKYLEKETVDFWDELSESEKEEIKLGISQLNDGNKIAFDDFLKKVS
jgi:hypothetical protein